MESSLHRVSSLGQDRSPSSVVSPATRKVVVDRSPLVAIFWVDRLAEAILAEEDDVPDPERPADVKGVVGADAEMDEEVAVDGVRVGTWAGKVELAKGKSKSSRSVVANGNGISIRRGNAPCPRSVRA